MWYPDLGTETQVWKAPCVRAVGWLDAEHEFPRGPSPPEVRERLAYFARLWGQSTQALGWAAAGGPHRCHVCSAFLASGNFGIPAGDVLYVCPEMIAHYVSAHDYLPPTEFLDAMMSAPGPGTIAYAVRVARFRDVFTEQLRAMLERRESHGEE